MKTFGLLVLASFALTLTGPVTEARGVAPTTACSYAESPDSTRPPIFTVAWVRWVVQHADAIARVRAIGPASTAVDTSVLSFGLQPIETEVLDVIAGHGVPTALTVFGSLYDFDIYPRESVPYVHSGYSTACYRSDFRRGGEHLLLLWRLADSQWTAFGPVFAPSMIQVTGADDPWVRWVRAVREGQLR